mgnify:CR=1 FL=1
MNFDNGKGLSKQQIEFFTKLINYYDKNGEDKLIKDIFENVASQKRQGKLSNEQIRQFVKNVSPMLNQKQKEKLNGLVEDLLKI